MKNVVFFKELRILSPLKITLFTQNIPLLFSLVKFIIQQNIIWLISTKYSFIQLIKRNTVKLFAEEWTMKFTCVVFRPERKSSKCPAFFFKTTVNSGNTLKGKQAQSHQSGSSFVLPCFKYLVLSTSNGFARKQKQGFSFGLVFKPTLLMILCSIPLNLPEPCVCVGAWVRSDFGFQGVTADSTGK